ncbi:TIGR02281 family clan AA aspartic protease [Tardiphaga alba]|uniref:TIGR02281 family clan AA aspartic protease n=1 Tax=Tardiphaga alba TaxID=340268 RepID=A0ABX8A8N4_9BRAD|nr:TIGR02281 family clan AA aspartic protease [Tardiphaga alba]QUS39356.1 TIGR02281 family clan AA aspartic protease [Tardiphaga alba]
MTRVFLLVTVIVATAGAALAYGDPKQISKAGTIVSDILRKQVPPPLRLVDVPRGNGGEFALQAKINGVTAPMIIDTGATSVVLSYETAKSIGLPIELLNYNIDVETVSGRTKAARLTLDRLAVGKLVERSVPALIVQRGQMKTNLLGMSFLDRLESWEVRPDKLMLRGYP